MAQPVEQPPAALTTLSQTVLRDESEAEELERLAGTAADEIQRLGDPAHRLAREADRLFLLGMAALSDGRTEEADRLFLSSVRSAEDSLAVGATGVAHRVLSSSLQQLLDLRGAFFQMANWRRALRSARTAIELDSESAAARVSLISYLGSAPAMAGGNRDEAARQLARALQLVNEDQSVEFVLTLWRARLDAADGNAREAEQALARAAEIYPESWLLREAEAEVRQYPQNQ